MKKRAWWRDIERRPSPTKKRFFKNGPTGQNSGKGDMGK